MLHQYVPAQQQVASGSPQNSAASRVHFPMHPHSWSEPSVAKTRIPVVLTCRSALCTFLQMPT